MIVSLDALKAHLNVTGDHDDRLLEQKLEAGHMAVENYCGLDFAIAFTAWTPAVVDLDTGETTTPEQDSDAPALLKEAVLRYAAHLYDCREALDIDGKSPAAPSSILEQVNFYRMWSF